jgi:hypothetical protein
MQTLIKKVREAAKGDCSMDWLIPYMQPRTLNKGVLFRKGDAAEEMYMLLRGSVRLMNVGVTIHPGTVSEIGIFAPSRQRMDTAICESDVDFEPPALEGRIVNQGALFSFLSRPDLDLDDWLARISKENDSGRPPMCKKLGVAQELKWEIRVTSSTTRIYRNEYCSLAWTGSARGSSAGIRPSARWRVRLQPAAIQAERIRPEMSRSSWPPPGSPV